MIETPCCGNCPEVACKFNLENNPQLKQEGIYFIWDAFRERGCLHHPNARAYLMKDVVEELEKKQHDSECMGSIGCMCNSHDGSAKAYAIAIALIKEGVKK